MISLMLKNFILFKETIIEKFNAWKTLVNISGEEINNIIHSRKSLLFNNTDVWLIKSGNPDFGVTLRTFDCAELCEIAISYIVHILGKNYRKYRIGLYCDDGLACFKTTRKLTELGKSS